jgi:hypothetical protein
VKRLIPTSERPALSRKENVMAERGSDKHGPHLDDQMKHEDQALIQGNQPPHAEEWRDTEPLPDETDSEEVRDAMRTNPAPEAGGTGEADGS